MHVFNIASLDSFPFVVYLKAQNAVLYRYSIIDVTTLWFAIIDIVFFTIYNIVFYVLRMRAQRRMYAY